MSYFLLSGVAINFSDVNLCDVSRFIALLHLCDKMPAGKTQYSTEFLCDKNSVGTDPLMRVLGVNM